MYIRIYVYMLYVYTYLPTIRYSVLYGTAYRYALGNMLIYIHIFTYIYTYLYIHLHTCICIYRGQIGLLAKGVETPARCPQGQETKKYKHRHAHIAILNQWPCPIRSTD